MTKDAIEVMEAIAHEKYLAKSIVAKCNMIETLVRQNAILQQDIQRLQEEGQSSCRTPQKTSN